ncbi:MAG: HipA domain-containing protein [Chitinophagales bacterium]|nr:HipA domain-containing protein [Chitinophagales bacterium]MCB9312568.1 HipA domain-containing protein [Lewinellaceae bacterium]
MSMPLITRCPGTLAEGFTAYSRTCQKRVFDGRSVSHILPYDSPVIGEAEDNPFDKNRQYISLSGVQEKFSVILDGNHLRLTREGERGTHILKPVPQASRRPDQMPANEHLTMQIARQIFGIETAENALIFFRNGDPAYITRRFDVREDGAKWAQEDFASLAGKTPSTHGAHYKYDGHYLELFQLMKATVPAYAVEAPKLWQLLLFNYLFSNGDAHLKNFSLIETLMGDFRLSPAYDLLNSRIHIEDSEFALEGGLLPPPLNQGTVAHRFTILAAEAGIPDTIRQANFNRMTTQSERVERLVKASYLDERTKRNYWQAYQERVKRLVK